MAQQDRRTTLSRVLVAASPPSFDGLAERLPEVAIEAVGLEGLRARVNSLRPRVVVCAVPDAAAGLDALVALRSARPETRLLFITPPEAEAERLAALEAGVDEALPTPISASELAGRISILLRRGRPGRISRLVVADGVELDLDRRELLRDGTWVHLRPMEARLLELFARSPGRVMTRPHILSRVWGPHHAGDPRTVDVHVRWLRAKIEPEPRKPVSLLTVRGVGYRLEPSPLTER